MRRRLRSPVRATEYGLYIFGWNLIPLRAWDQAAEKTSHVVRRLPGNWLLVSTARWALTPGRGAALARSRRTRLVVLGGALLLAPLTLGGTELRRVALAALILAGVVHFALLRNALRPRCGYCGSRSCDHHTDPLKGHPIYGSLFDWMDRTDDIRAAARGEGRSALLSLVTGRLSDDEFRTHVLSLVRDYPGAALAVIERYADQARTALRGDDLATLLAVAGDEDRLRIISMLGNFRGTDATHSGT